MVKTRLGVAVTLGLFGLGIVADEPRYPPITGEGATLAPFAYLVDELDQRRRLQFLFPNPQTIFDGLNLGYVQTSTGNLTFQRRDLVVLDEVALIASRIHDSQATANTGFGPRWRFNLGENAVITDGLVKYVDWRGAIHTYVHRRGAVYEPAIPSPATIGSTFGLLDDLAVHRDAEGTIRQFRDHDGRGHYALVRQTSPNGTELRFHYEAARLVGVTVNQRDAIELQWSEDRIQRLTDRHGRQVIYRYDDMGRLIGVNDVAGQLWTYRYDADHRLIRGAYPDGQTYLEIAYNGIGQVVRSTGARDFSYRYEPGFTVVEEPDAHQHTLVHNKSGTTIEYESNQGIGWQITVDGKQRPTTVRRSSGSYSLTYSTDHNRLETLVHPGGTMQVEYDETGRFKRSHGEAPESTELQTVAYSNNGTISVRTAFGYFSYQTDERGNISKIDQDDRSYSLEYDGAMRLVQVTSGSQRMAFERDERERIAAVRFPSGSFSEYTYDALGNRNLAQFSTGNSMHITHDGRGNIVGVTDRTRTGEELTQTYVIDAGNRVREVQFPGPSTLRIDYDTAGRPRHIHADGRRVLATYNAHGTLLGLSANQSNWQPKTTIRPPTFVRPQSQIRHLIHSEQLWDTQPDYGYLQLHPRTLDMNLRQAAHVTNPNLELAQVTLNTIVPWFAEDSSRQFNRPSNAIFQPPEYESTNCCMACSWMSRCGQMCTTQYGTNQYTETCNCDGSGIASDPCARSNEKSVQIARQTLVNELQRTPLTNLEIAMRTDCPNVGTIAWQSKRAYCIKIRYKPDQTVYAAHTHPYHTEDDVKTKFCCVDRSGKEKCEMYRDREEIRSINVVNMGCSINDRIFKRNSGIPLLLKYMNVNDEYRPRAKTIDC